MTFSEAEREAFWADIGRPAEGVRMEGLVPGRVVLYTDSDGKVHPSIVTAVHNADTGLINCTSIVDGYASVFPRVTVPHDQSGVLTHTWAWMYQGQATRGNAK